MPTSLCFNDVPLTPVTHQNSLWIRAAELARALGYKQENSISRLYRSNVDEFSPDMTQVIEIPVESRFGSSDNLSDGRCRIFSLRGCHLIAMFARTPVAKAFRRWVLDVLETLEQPGARIDTPFITPGQQAQLHAIVDAKVGMLPAAARRRGYKEMWTRFNRHFRIARYVQLPAERMGDAVGYLVAMELRAGETALPQREIQALPPADNAPRSSRNILWVTEAECRQLVEDITRTHLDVMRLLKPVRDRLCNISLRLAIETEQRAGMGALRHTEGESLQGMLFSGSGKMLTEAMVYPNERELPLYCNPGYFLLGICRQLRSGRGM